jgi:hypothetical protein
MVFIFIDTLTFNIRDVWPVRFMDPLSISAAVAGFLSLAMDISKILKDYIDGVQTAHEDAQNLLKEVAVLCHVLEKLVQFLRSEDLVKGKRFDKTSVLLLAADTCQRRLESSMGASAHSAGHHLSGAAGLVNWSLG